MAAREVQRGVTLAAVRKWPATVNVGQAALALGVSRASLYEALARGERPVEVITVGRRMKVLTASLLKVLEGGGSRQAVSA
jgi:hypothetical protein